MKYFHCNLCNEDVGDEDETFDHYMEKHPHELMMYTETAVNEKLDKLYQN